METTLGAICLPVASVQPEDFPGEEFTYFDIGGIDNERNRIAETKTVRGRNAPSRARQVLRRDDILFSTVRTYLRNIAKVERDYPNPVASTGFAVLRAPAGVSPQFLLFQVLSEDFLRPLNALQTGSSYPAVRARDVLAQPILLAPTREQERIVAKLNAAFAGVERAEIAARRAQERLRRYRSAVLGAALTGEISRDMRVGDRQSKSGAQLLKRILNERRTHWQDAELKRLRGAGKEPKDDGWRSSYPEPVEPATEGLPKLPAEWEWASAEQLTEATRPISYGVIKLGAQVEDGIPVLRSSDVRHLRIDLSRVKRIAKEVADEYRRTYLNGGEVLVTIRGTLGGVASVPAECAGYNISREVAMLALVEPATSAAVAYFIGAGPLQEWLGRRTRGIAYTGINIQSLRTLPIPVAPLTEQIQIARELSRRLSAAEQLAATLDQQVARSAVTRQLLLREAFAGRLVPQDPSDEPASYLVKNARVERDVEARSQKGKNVPKQKSKDRTAHQSLLTILRENGGAMTPEELFHLSGHSQESVEQFFAELRQLTTAPAKITQERRADAVTLLKATP